MTAAAYTSDLSSQTITTADAAAAYAEATATGWTDAGTTTQPDTDVFIQGTGSGTYPLKTGIGAALANAGSPVTVPTDGAYLIWCYHAAPNTLATEANGGIRIIAGDSLSAFIGWKVGGSDTYVYGGWQCLACDPAQTKDYTAGAPTEDGVYQYVGLAYNQSGTVNRGNPMVLDALRYGRCEMRIAGGTSPDAAATLAGASSTNDNISNRWGLFQAVGGGYLWQGMLVLGYSAAVRLTSSNTQVLVANTKRVSANFNRIEIRNASSEVNLTKVSFLALGTVSKGRLEVVDDCDVNISQCSFTGMDTFIFKAASGVLDSSFSGCGQITANGATMNGTSVSGYEGSSDSSALIWNVNTNPNGRLDACAFTKGTAATHAIEFGTNCPTTMTLTDVKFTGYNASNGQTDSAVYFADKGSDTTWTLNIEGVGDAPSYKKARAGDTVNIVTGTVPVKVTVRDADTQALLDDVRILLYAATGASVTITSSGGTATVAHTGHGKATNDKVNIRGANEGQYNGVKTITVTGANEYTYPISGSPSSPATGTITSHRVFLDGTTSGGTGYLTTSISYTTDITVAGRARRYSVAPSYKTGPIGGSIVSTGYDATAFLVRE